MRGIRPLAGAAVALLAVATTGCWDRVEVNDLAVVTGVALDQAGPGSVELTVAMAVPSRIRPPGAMGGGTPAPPTATRSATGRTVMEAIGALQLRVDRRLYWAHNQVILVGESLAYGGVKPLLSFFVRHRQPRMRAAVAVVPGRAADVLAATPPIDLVTPVALHEMQGMRAGVLTNLRDFVSMLGAEGLEPLTARVEALPERAAQPKPQGAGADGKEGPRTPVITGAAVFKDDRLVGYLDEEETRGVVWVRSQLTQATTALPLGRSGPFLGFELVRTSTRLRPRFEDGRVTMEVHVDSEHVLDENAALVDTGDPEVMHLVQQALSASIARLIRRSVARAQRDLRSDVLGFGQAVRRADPRRWRAIGSRWDQLFPHVGVEVRVHAAIRRAGLAFQPAGVDPGRLLRASQLRRILGVK